jgi:peptidoglycan/LPS O-acetylase OafA/YrhL
MLLTRAEGGPGGSGRIQSLDMLRALAVFLVIGHHAAWRFRPETTDALGQMFKGSGWIGVDIFFVISGFMITTILVRDQDDIKGFFIRRFYRIVPIFAVAIATFAASALLTGQGVDRLRWLWSPALFLNGWTIPFLGYGTVPYTIAWSLSVEETAYILLGLACFAHRRGLRVALLSFLLVAPLVRAAALLGGWFDPADLYFFVPARLDSIALGGLAALAAPRRSLPPWTALVAGAAMFGLIWIFQYTRVSDPRLILVGYTAFGVVTSLFVLAVGLEPGARTAAAPAAWHAALRPLRNTVATFGKLSYFIYLFHLFVLEGLLVVQRGLQLALGFWTALALATAIVFGLAALSWKYFEYPLIRKGRERTSPGRRSTMVPSPEAPA